MSAKRFAEVHSQYPFCTRSKVVGSVENVVRAAVIIDQNEMEIDERLRINPGRRIREGKIEIIRPLGSGSFGIVYLGREIETGMECALKFSLDRKELRTEAIILLAARKHRRELAISHMCEFFGFGRFGSKYYTVMSVLGPDLRRLQRSAMQQLFSNSTATQLALETLDAIDEVHMLGYIHRDIKPSNFAIGTGNDARTIFIFDFGLSRKFRTGGKFVEPSTPGYFVGTVKYASHRAHRSQHLSQKDDLSSWLFSVIEFYRGRLPWDGIRNRDEVLEMKRQETKTLVTMIGGPFGSIHRRISATRHGHDPDYQDLRTRLRNYMRQNNYKPSDSYDGERPRAYADAPVGPPPTPIASEDVDSSSLTEE